VSVVHDGTTKPIVETDVLIPGGHRPEVVVSNPGDFPGGSGGGGGIVRGPVTPAAVLTITLGADSQEVFPANANRDYLLIQNVSDENLWVRIGADATTAPPSVELLSGGLGILEYGEGGGFVPDGVVNIIGATAGKAFVAWEGVRNP
jgi:hypothetical protein